ncbi:hypothetical protein ACFQ0T_02535 [Kitasatospora gansuensis]
MAGSMSASAAEATPPLTVEGFSYPGAAQILAEQHVTLKSGDGNIQLADCTSTDNLIEVFSRTFDTGSVKVCFKVTGPTGYLALELPKVYSVKGDDHTVKATLNTGGSVSSVDIKKNLYTPVGEGTSTDGTTLLELNATDGPAAAAVTTDTPAVGSLVIGQPGRAGSRACTATLVDRIWALTSAAASPTPPPRSPASAPATKSTVTIGGKTVDIVELVPRTDRDLVMARLAGRSTASPRPSSPPPLPRPGRACASPASAAPPPSGVPSTPTPPRTPRAPSPPRASTARPRPAPPRSARVTPELRCSATRTAPSRSPVSPPVPGWAAASAPPPPRPVPAPPAPASTTSASGSGTPSCAR